MLKTLTVCLTLMVGAGMLQAQDQTPGATPSGSGASTSTQNPGTPAQTGASGETSVEGCLAGSNGSFTLTDNSGMTYQLTGDTSKLAEHVGHEVKIKGATSGSGAGMSGAGSASAGASAGASGSAASSLDVKSVKMVSKTCKTAGK